MRKYLVFLFAIVFISSVSAADWDNVLSYSNNDLTATITNAFGLGSELGKVTLTSHKSVGEVRKVMPGEDRVVMVYEFEDWENVYENGLGKVEFINLHNNAKIDKDYHFAVPIYENRNFPVREEVCTGEGDERKCYQSIKSYIQKQVIKEWRRLDGNNIPKGTTTIGLVTDVHHEDYIDGVWTIAGKSISRHAVWSSSLDNGLVVYYDFETNTTSTVIDVSGNSDNMNGTILGDGRANFTDGFLGTGFAFTDGESHNNNITSVSNINITGDCARTIAFWINDDPTGDDQHLVLGWGAEVNTQQVFLGVAQTGDQYQYSTRNDDVYLAGWVDDYENTWQFLAYTFDNSSGTANVTIWHNGTAVGEGEAIHDTLLSKLFVGTPPEQGNTVFNGTIDELGIWNRTLTPSEISDLWNNGAGLTFEDVSSITTSLLNPSTGIESINSTYVLNASASSSDVDIQNMTFTVWDSENYSLVYEETNIVYGHDGDTNYSNVSFSPTYIGNFEWNCEACGDNATGANCDIGNANFTINKTAFSQNTHTYNTTSFEMLTEQFIFNGTYNNTYFTDVSTNFIYNGTSYLGTVSKSGDSFVSTRSINVPIVTGSESNFTFYWEILMTDASSTTKYNSTKNNQTVSQIVFTRCNSTYNTPLVVNYTVYNETWGSQINVTMDGSFTYWLGDGSVKKNYTVDSSESNYTFDFCTNSNETFTVDAIINLDATGYNERTYYLTNETYNNATSERFLYLLNSTLGTNVIIQVKDSGLVPVKGYSVSIERYYPSSNTYKEIITEETDEYGQFVARLIENTVKYKFTFRDENSTIKKTTGDMTIACRSAICVLPFVIEDTTDDFERFDNVTDYDWTFSFDNSTNIFTFTWNDISGVSATNWLEVKRYLFNGTTSVCNTTSTASSGSLTCNIGASEASYQAQVFRKVSGGAWRRIATLSKEVGTGFETFGKEGYIWAFFLLMTAIAVGYWFPPVGIILYGALSLLTYFTKIIYVNPAILIAELLIVVLFCWAFSGRKS